MFIEPCFLTFYRRLVVGAATALLSVAASCTYSHGDDNSTPTPCDTSPQSVTYAGVISPIFDAHCRECHASNVASVLGGGNDFGNYQTIKRYPAASILKSIEHAPGYNAMPKGRPKLSDCDILRIKAWMDAGEPNN